MPATEKYWRNLPTMHVVFAVSSFGLLFATLWMMAADHDREWRVYQQAFQQLEAARLRTAKAELETPEYGSKIKELEKELESQTAALMDERQKASALEADVDALQGEFSRADRDAKFQRAKRDVDRANYDIAVRDAAPEVELERLKEIFDRSEERAGELDLYLQEVTSKLEVKQAELAARNARRDEVQKELAAAQTDVERVHKALVKLDPETTLAWSKRQIMEWPIIDGFNSPLKIQQDWLPGLTVNYGGMRDVARFDRCRSCHLGIDRTEKGNVPTFPPGLYPQPFTTHPRTDVYLSAASPHPLNKFGCTVCHEGQGSGTSFSNASHTPNDPSEHHEWAKEHDFAANHYWEFPMLPERFREASCIKCHHDVVELGTNPQFGATAPKVVEGYDIVRKFGCFGCHEINGYDGTKPIGPDLRLEPATPEEAAKLAADPTARPGKMRKVGPALRHLASKTTPEWTGVWTRNPSEFRPTTRMPQFFHLAGQLDHDAEKFTPVELASVTQYLFDKSESLDYLKPSEGYEPDAERGKVLFSQRGCLSCHSHKEFPEVKADFGPDLSRVHEKLQGGEAGFAWLYTWVREPERHHPRTKMPNLFLEEYVEGEATIDPAADIAAYLLEGGPEEFDTIAYSPNALKELATLYLKKVLTSSELEELEKGKFTPETLGKIKGDEVEIFSELKGDGSNQIDEVMLLNYVGRRTISRYGCYGCHDIPGFENSRPIGTALQNWGRKDSSKLALEHINEFLHHHGEPGGEVWLEELEALLVKPEFEGKIEHWEHKTINELGAELIELAKKLPGNGESSKLGLETREFLKRAREAGVAEIPAEELPLGASTRERAERAATLGVNGGFATPEEAEREESVAFYYDRILHKDRSGFLWQKLRAPRSYDYHKTETKYYDERLRMPKFPFTQEQIEAVSTFVLGLVAEPPSSAYLYQPTGAVASRIEGEKLLTKYNCGGCHVLDLPEIQYGVDLESLSASVLDPGDFEQGRELLLKLKPAHDGLTLKVHKNPDGEELPVVKFHGLLYNADADTDFEDREYSYDLWETLDVGGKVLFPGSRMLVPATSLVSYEPPRGGAFAEFLVDSLMHANPDMNRYLAWQASPPPLYQEGLKVQTPWLFNFLKNPGRIRYTTVLRMPRFNMSDDEAATLANYFSAVDGSAYPYQDIPQRDPAYLEEKFQEDPHYLSDSWKMLNAPLCIKCHALGGREYQSQNPKTDIRGPNLSGVPDRLRPEWTQLWLFNPQWITPYTSMPARQLRRDSKQFEEVFNGDGLKQVISIRDALMNYHRLMESEGKYIWETTEPDPAAATEEKE